MIFSFSRMCTRRQVVERLGALAGLEQERAARRRPASEACSWRASPAKTSGGTIASRARAASARSSLGHSGWWSAGKVRHEEGVQAGLVTAIGVSV